MNICYRSTARRSAGNIWWGCTRATAGGKLMHWVLTCCLGWNTITCTWTHSQECELTWLPRWINKRYALYFPCPWYCLILYRYSVQVLLMQWSWWAILKWPRPSDLFVSLTDSLIAWMWAVYLKAGIHENQTSTHIEPQWQAIHGTYYSCWLIT